MISASKMPVITLQEFS